MEFTTAIKTKLLYCIVIFLIIILLIRIYKLNKCHNDRCNNGDNFIDNISDDISDDDIENFESVINKFKLENNASNASKNNKIKRNRKNSNNRKNKGKNNDKITFDDLVKEGENLNVNNYTVDSIKEDFWKYANSFKSDKFTNVTGTTNESLEKLSLFKDKFFEIFE